MSPIRNQLRTAHAHVDGCETLALSIDHAGTVARDLGWLKEDLVKARSSLKEIDPLIVEAFRRQRKPTDDVLDKQ